MSSLRALGAVASLLLLASAQPAAACMNAMEEEPAAQTDLLWVALPAVFLVAMLAATIFLVLRFHGGGAESKESGT